MTEKQENAIKEVDNILNNFLKPFDCTADIDTDFAYYSAHNLISYAFVLADEHAKTFMDFVHKLFPEIKADIFLWSFLHELGHHETEDDFEEEEWEEYINTISSIEDDYEYYNQPIEYAATYWAGEYILNHSSEIEKLWNKLTPAIKLFYTEMEITE